jgi:D-alanyl-D-alanine carboxypeptidase.
MNNRWMRILLAGMVLLFFSSPGTGHAEPSISIQSSNAIVMDQQSGRIFYGKNIHEKRPIASITKIMTAILAIESGKLDEMVKVSEQAVRAEGSSIYLKPGEKIRLRDLVYGLMLRSGNDAALAIAEYVGGSVEGFVFLMNEKAKILGMENTRFANPHGLDGQGTHYSTAYDMAILTRYAMGNKTFREIAGTKVHRAPGPEGERIWYNKHRLVTGMYKYATGGKTGYTKRANRTLVTTAKKDGMELIAVTLDSLTSKDWKEHIQMFDYVYSRYKYVTILREGMIREVREPFYQEKVYLTRDLVYPLTEEELDHIEVKYRLMKPKRVWKFHPERIPEVVGRAEVYLGEKRIGRLAIEFGQSEERSSFLESVKRLFGMFIGVQSDG